LDNGSSSYGGTGTGSPPERLGWDRRLRRRIGRRL